MYVFIQCLTHNFIFCLSLGGCSDQIMVANKSRVVGEWRGRGVLDMVRVC